MKPHHEAWLKSHPQYDVYWLSQALGAGFDVHHLDGDHHNNDPENLALIEHSDHMRLHNSGALRLQIQEKMVKKEVVIKLGDAAYHARCSSHDTWQKIAASIGYEDTDKGGRMAFQAAACYAKAHGKLWPIPHPDSCHCPRCKSKRTN